MTISMYQSSVPVFIRQLNNLSNILNKALAHCEAKKIDHPNNDDAENDRQKYADPKDEPGVKFFGRKIFFSHGVIPHRSGT